MSFLDIIQKKIFEESNTLGINILNELHESKDCNIFLSPLSISTALGILHLGSKNETNKEFRQFLGYIKNNITDIEAHLVFNRLFNQLRISNTSKFVVSFATHVIAHNDHEISQNYKYMLKLNYNASVIEVDFVNNGLETLKEINDWVSYKNSDKTSSIIEELLPKDTKIIVVSPIYFKGFWLHKFNPENTHEATFINFGNTKTKVQMMYKHNAKFKFFASTEFEANILELPFIGDCIRLYIVLPHKLNGLKKTASVLTDQNINSTIDLMQTCRVNLYLPKFNAKSSISIVDELKSLGLVKIFENIADLSGINGQNNLKLSEMVQKIFIELTEEGSEYTGTSEVSILNDLCDKSPQKSFKVDHPFIFLIRDRRNNANLFYGQISHL